MVLCADAATAPSWPLQRFRALQLLLPGNCDAFATLPDAALLLPGLCGAQVCYRLRLRNDQEDCYR